jgi:hypothetical protein
MIFMPIEAPIWRQKGSSPSRIHNGVETLAPGVIVDDLNCEDRPPDAFLLWNTWVQIGE